ncbi:MAG TPA: 4Fe-4S binding protein [Gallionella sp.]|nr:4Fe-4S binding protein [Gallionella sp.]
MHANKYRLPRRSIQIGTLMLISLIPALGIFRVDLASASFHVLSHQIWWSNFFFISGLAIVVATVPIITYLTVGAVWCGWACPQNLLSEWANNLTYKFLGKRADVRVDGKGMVVAAAKNKVVNWLILGAIFLAASMVLALVPLLLFYPNGEIWDFVTFSASPEMTESMKYAYFFLVLLIFIDIAFVRYFFCDYACFYRMGHILFKTKDALHINYDASRSSDCAKCNYCATSCITAIQPTDIKVADPCIGCGECIDACDRLHEKTGTTGLLRFDIGQKVGDTTWGQKLRVFFSRLNWPIGIIFAYGCALMAWGIATQAPAKTLLSPAQLHKIEFIARTCDSRCSVYASTCKGSNIAGCYRASACECECKAQLDPGNPALGSWQQCSKKFTSLAKVLESRDKH